MTSTGISTRAAVRAALRSVQDAERAAPPCVHCGRPIITARLALDPVVQTGRRYVTTRIETSADLGACDCAERAGWDETREHWQRPAGDTGPCPQCRSTTCPGWYAPDADHDLAF